MSSELGLTPLAQMGLGFGIVSCWLSTLANIYVKRDHKEVMRLKYNRKEVPRIWLRPQWLLILLLYILSAAFIVAAFSFTPFALVISTCTYAIATNWIFARSYLAEHYSVLEGLGVCLVVLGCALTVYFGVERAFDRNWDEFLLLGVRTGFLVFAGCHAFTLLAAFAVSHFIKAESHMLLREHLLGRDMRAVAPSSGGVWATIRTAALAYVASGTGAWLLLAFKYADGLVKFQIDDNAGRSDPFESGDYGAPLLVVAVPLLGMVYLAVLRRMLTQCEATTVFPVFTYFLVFSLHFLSTVFFDRQVTAEELTFLFIGLGLSTVGVGVVLRKAYYPNTNLRAFKAAKMAQRSKVVASSDKSTRKHRFSLVAGEVLDEGYRKVLASDDSYRDLPPGKLCSDDRDVLEGFATDDQHNRLLHRDTGDSMSTPVGGSRDGERDFDSRGLGEGHEVSRTFGTEHDTFLQISSAPAAPLITGAKFKRRRSSSLDLSGSFSSAGSTSHSRSEFSNPSMHPQTHQMSHVRASPSRQTNARHDADFTDVSSSSLSNADTSALLDGARRHSRFSSLGVRPVPVESASISLQEVTRMSFSDTE